MREVREGFTAQELQSEVMYVTGADANAQVPDRQMESPKQQESGHAGRVPFKNLWAAAPNSVPLDSEHLAHSPPNVAMAGPHQHKTAASVFAEQAVQT